MAFYTVLADTAESRVNKPENPTLLGDESLRLIKRIVAKRGLFSYDNLANIFKKQTQDISYYNFKLSLKEYLIYSLTKNECVQYLEQHISERLEELYTSYDDKTINDALLLRTCNRIIEYLTTEDHETPSVTISHAHDPRQSSDLGYRSFETRSFVSPCSHPS